MFDKKLRMIFKLKHTMVEKLIIGNDRSALTISDSLLAENNIEFHPM